MGKPHNDERRASQRTTHASGKRPSGGNAPTPKADPREERVALTRLLLTQYGDATFKHIAEGLDARRPVTLRANTLKTTPADLARNLGEAGIVCRSVPFSPDAFVIDGAREDAVRATAAYENGELYLQSLSAMLPALALAPKPGENILDMAAAPGGKTCQMAALSGGEALITACEKNHVRAERLRYNLEKQGASRVNVMECDARSLDELFTFDKVLLDAPCSGSGTVPLAEGRPFGFSRELLARSMKTQKELLKKAVEVLRPGGMMVYATCSILAEENECVLEAVLPHTRAQLMPLPKGLLEGVPLLPSRLPHVACICPTDLFEGFFMALIRKN